MNKVLGMIAGVIVMFVVYIAVQLIGPALHPIPVGLDPRDPAAMAGWVNTMPFSAQAVTALSWLLGAFAGGWVAMLIARWAPAAWGVAAITALISVPQLFRFDYPLWMQIAAVAAPLLGGWLAIRLGARADDPING
ncbi:MAG: hypothetical protein V4808_01430 [Pseudomonadota bacterium]